MGDHGKKYYYDPNSEDFRSDAKHRAIVQGIAIESSVERKRRTGLY